MVAGLSVVSHKILGHHFTQAFETHDFRFRTFIRVSQNSVAMIVVGGPEGLFANVDAIQGGDRDAHAPIGDQARHVAIEEGQQQRGDVMSVGIGIGQQNDSIVAQCASNQSPCRYHSPAR